MEMDIRSESERPIRPRDLSPEAYARMCQSAAGHPSRLLKAIGVVGVRGKRTTGCLIAGVLTAAGRRIGMAGSLGCLDGRGLEASAADAPTPERLATLLANMVHNECSHAVLEVSDRALDQSCFSGVCFDAVCATCADPRQKLFDRLELAEGGFAVFDADDPASAALLDRLQCPTLTVGIHAAAEITATPVEQFLSEQTFLLHAGSETAPVRTAMIGERHIRHCLAAAAVGLAYEIELTTIVRGLESVGHVPGRLERIECGQPFGVFVDEARSPESIAIALKTLRPLTTGRLICVFAGDDRGGTQRRSPLGHPAERIADIAIATPHDRGDAICRALALAQPGDCVLIAGGNCSAAPVGDNPHAPPDDREIAQAWLYREGQLPVG